jgi:REP element-mobilizing transposase RayT
MKYTISIDNPCLFITAVGKDRLPVFRSDAIKQVTCNAIDEARTSCGFLLFAYVIMPDHIHVLTDRPRERSKVLQFIKGIVSRRVNRPSQGKELRELAQKTTARELETESSLFFMAT